MDTQNVTVDIYPWVEAADRLGYVPMTGIYRHADSLAHTFDPAVMLPPDQSRPERGLKLLRAFLSNRFIIEFENREQPRGIWLSLGVDHLCPELMPTQCGLATIVHDVMSMKGFYGPRNVELFKKGVELNGIFLCVSKTTERYFRNWLEENKIQKPNILEYGGFLSSVFKFPTEDRIEASLSVSTVFKYKRIDKVALVSKILGCEHFHVGGYGDCTEAELDACFKTLPEPRPPFYHVDQCSDDMLVTTYAKCKYFICMSDEEGFSLPPLEAMIAGVPYIILSDIPVHREIYGDYSVNFIKEPSDLLNGSIHLKKITIEDRQHASKKYSFKEAIKPFLQFVYKME